VAQITDVTVELKRGEFPDPIDVGQFSLLFSFQCRADTLLNSPEF